MPDTVDDLRRELGELRRSRTPAARRGRRWPWVVAAGVLLLVAGVAVRQRAGRAVEVEVVPVAVVLPEGPGVPVLSGAGYVVSGDRYISIGVRVPGRIDRYMVEEGDRVQKGDPLVQIDAREYEATVARARAALALARATADLARKQVERARPLGRAGIISREELDVREAEARTAAAAVAQAEADLHAAEVALEYTTLYAPRSGVILAKLKEVGEIAVPGGFSGSGDLIRMANLEDMRGQVDVTEAELSKILLGQRAEVVPDAYPDRPYAARVVKLYPQVDRQKGTLRVEAQIDAPDDRLWPDMSVRITFFRPIETRGPAGALLVPRTAVRTDGDAPFVWTVVEGRAHRAPVSLGAAYGDRVHVTGGLAGDAAVVVGDAPLAEGQAVRGRV